MADDQRHRRRGNPHGGCGGDSDEQHGRGAEPAAGLLPDIVEEVPHHLQIQNTQQGEFLRFSTTHVNVGEGPLQIRGGDQVAPCVIEGVSYDQCTHAVQEIVDAKGQVVSSRPAGVALFHPEHNHWHQDAVAEFAIVTDDGVTEATGTKVTFCLVDVKHYGSTGTFKKDYPRTYFECNGALQGIAPAGVTSTITRRRVLARRRVMVLVTPARGDALQVAVDSKYVRG